MYNSSLTVSCVALKILFASHLWLSFQLVLFHLWKYGRNQAHFFALPCGFPSMYFPLVSQIVIFTLATCMLLQFDDLQKIGLSERQASKLSIFTSCFL
jgi:hypothetical protein